MSSGKEWRGYELTFPRLSKAAQNTEPDNMAFLSVMRDFNLSAITKNCMYIRAAILESIKRPEFLDLSADEMFKAVAEMCSEEYGKVKNGMSFAFEILWDSCDEKRLIEKYFPYQNNKKMPYYTDTMEFMRFFYDMVLQRYLYLRGARG